MTQETAIGRGAQKGGSKTLTIEFETFGFFAGASRIGCGIDRILDAGGGGLLLLWLVVGEWLRLCAVARVGPGTSRPHLHPSPNQTTSEDYCTPFLLLPLRLLHYPPSLRINHSDSMQPHLLHLFLPVVASDTNTSHLHPHSSPPPLSSEPNPDFHSVTTSVHDTTSLVMVLPHPEKR